MAGIDVILFKKLSQNQIIFEPLMQYFKIKDLETLSQSVQDDKHLEQYFNSENNIFSIIIYNIKDKKDFFFFDWNNKDKINKNFQTLKDLQSS